MIQKLQARLSDKHLHKITKEAKLINKYEESLLSLSDEELQNKTEEFRQRLYEGETLDFIAYEAFAVVREASKRVLGMRQYDVQMVGGLVLHKGDVAEMKTGEGKTLVGVAPAYLNALTGKGVHIITVNEYLSQRDCELMMPIYEFLGLTVGFNNSTLNQEEKQEVYSCDITFGTNNEFAFDYLRDNMVFAEEEKVQRPLHYALIDEVDSVLIDEARTPLIVSGSTKEDILVYEAANHIVSFLKEDDFDFDVKTKNVQLMPSGVTKVEKFFDIDNLFDIHHVGILHKVNQSLHAHIVMKKDIDYVVQEDKIIIVDQFTGRLMDGRRYSNGLHQAIEAKEKVKVNKESSTLATITFQNFFRMYEKLSGMTGTAKTEEEEFNNIYNMDVVVIPTNKPVLRQDKADLIYKSKEAKYNAIVKEIEKCFDKGQPVLVGTADIDTSEHISYLLKEKGLPHNVLNAKQHEREAEIIQFAGEQNSITIATNMAGRGTDIKLGEGVVDLGGLAVIGTERHESRRIDNQLRGRSGRQGDPGYSLFFVSLEDDLIKRFASDNLLNMMDKLGFDDETPIESKMVTKSIEQAQKRIEGNNFDARKQLLQYDDVLREQREIIYAQRNKVISSDHILQSFIEMSESVSDFVLAKYDIADNLSDKKLEELVVDLSIHLQLNDVSIASLQGKNYKELLSTIQLLSEDLIKNKYFSYPDEFANNILKTILLQTVDEHWVSHLKDLESIKEGIHLRAYAQVDPLREYQFEGFNLFENMVNSIQQESLKRLAQTEFNM